MEDIGDLLFFGLLILIVGIILAKLFTLSTPLWAKVVVATSLGLFLIRKR